MKKKLFEIGELPARRRKEIYFEYLNLIKTTQEQYTYAQFIKECNENWWTFKKENKGE